MSLTVYGAPLSPFVRKVRLCLLEKDLPYELEIVTPFGQPAWYRDINPLGRIPALRDGELTLADSSVICQYLEEQYSNLLPLYGDNPADTARIRWLEKYCDYELAPLCTFTVFRNRVLKPTMGKTSDEAAIREALTNKLPPHFDYLEQQLGNAEYFVGARLSMADLALACQLTNMAHGGETLDTSRWPALAAHHQRIEARASYQAVLPGERRTLDKLRGQA